MRGNLIASFLYIGTILLAFGIVISVIELLALRYGTHHETAAVMAIALLAAGALLLGASIFMRRSGEAASENR